MLKIALFGVLFSATAALAQSPLPPSGFPPQTVSPQATFEAPTAGESRRGIFIATINIEIDSKIPSGHRITCLVGMGHAGGGATYSETASVYATRKGAKGKCVVRVPYSWPQASPTGFVTYTVQVGAYATGQSLNIEGISRTHYRYESKLGVPANEKTTRLKYDVRI